MSGIINVTEFEQDVTEYKMLHKATVENFLHGVIRLGEVLSKQRDKWKPEGKWCNYLKEIGLNEAHAGVQIRTYEYSLKDMKTLMDVNTQNFKQLQKFLKLGEEDKKTLAGEIDGEALPTTEFIEKIEMVTQAEESDIDLELISADYEANLEILDIEDLDFSSMIQSPAMADIPFMAKQILDTFDKLGKVKMSKNCLPIIETFLHVQRSAGLIQANIHKLDETELEYWNEQLVVQVGKLSSLLNLTKVTQVSW